MAKQLIKGAAREAGPRPQAFKSTIKQAERVDHEAEFECVVSLKDFKKRIAIPLKEKTSVRGFFAVLENNRGKIKVKRHLIKNTEGLKSFLKSEVAKRSRLLEVDTFAIGVDSTVGLPPNNEFIPLQGGPFNKQLYLYDYLAQHAKAFQAKNHNPLAKEAVDVITFFSMGKGAVLKFRAPELQAAWDGFAKRNRFNEFVRMDSDTITWAGEIMTHKTHFSDGFPCIKHIDPSTVWEIVTNPQDITEAYYFHQQFPTQWQLVYKPGDISSEYVVNDIPAEEVVHVKINTVPGEKRGRSDLFSVLGWLKRFKDFYDAKVTKAQIEESWAIRKTIKGNAGDVDAVFNDPTITAVPSPGSVIIENEAITTDYMTPTTSSGQATDNVGEAIRSIVATGMGLSPEYLGVGGKSSTRAASITKSEPAERKFEDRQMFMESYIRQIADWFIEEAIAKGFAPKKQARKADLAKLKKAVAERSWIAVIKEATAMIGLTVLGEPIDKNYEVIFPEIGTEDRSMKIKDIATAQALKAISKERSSTMIAKELGITSYDYAEEQEAIRQEAEEAALDPEYNGAPDQAAAGFRGRPAGGAAAPAPTGGAEAPAGDGKPTSKADDKAFKDAARK